MRISPLAEPSLRLRLIHFPASLLLRTSSYVTQITQMVSVATVPRQAHRQKACTTKARFILLGHRERLLRCGMPSLSPLRGLSLGACGEHTMGPFPSIPPSLFFSPES